MAGIINAGAAPISKPGASDAAAQSDEPMRLATLPAGAHQVYEFWKSNLRPSGLKFTGHIINYPGGKPGDVGLFFSCPKDSMDL